MKNDDSVFVLVRQDNTFCIQDFNVFSSTLESAPTYTAGETKLVTLQPGEHWEMIVPLPEAS